MRAYTIKNEIYELTVSDHGAEIRSLKKHGKEIMWQADPKFWGRTSPILFPLVGNYWKKKSRYKGEEYEMSQHGFARDKDFSLVKQSDDELLFELKNDAETLKVFPFNFVLQIGYMLSSDGVRVSWTVKNPLEAEMFFSIGGHPAFNCDLAKDSLEFFKDNKPVSDHITANIIEGDGSGCLSDRTKELALENGTLKLSDDLFDEDALIIEGMKADKVVLLDSDGERLVEVLFDAPLFGVWSPAGRHAPFVCIEPWYGRCDRVGFTDDLSAREYENKLLPNGVFQASYLIR